MEEVSKMGDLAHQHTQDKQHDACHVNIASCCYSVCIHSNVKCFSSGTTCLKLMGGRAAWRGQGQREQQSSAPLGMHGMYAGSKSPATEGLGCRGHWTSNATI